MTRPLARWAGLALLSGALSFAFYQTGFQAALLVGPMIAAIAFGVAGAGIRLPRWGFLAAQAVIGSLVGHTLTPGILRSLGADWQVMGLIVLSTVLAGAAVGWSLVKFGRLPGTTAAWGSSPGAASAMVVMAEEYGADARLVAFMQYLRVVIVVMSASLASRLLLGSEAAAAIRAADADWFAVPALSFAESLLVVAVGGLAGHFLRFPASGLLAPMLAAAIAQLTGLVDITLPPWLLSLSYLGLGWYIGLGFTRSVLAYALRALPQLILSVLLLIGLCGGSAWLLTRLLHTDALTAYLATSPGGLDSITVIAVGSGADTPFVLAVQTLRLFIVLLTGPQIAKLISHYA